MPRLSLWLVVCEGWRLALDQLSHEPRGPECSLQHQALHIGDPPLAHPQHGVVALLLGLAHHQVNTLLSLQQPRVHTPVGRSVSSIVERSS